MKKLFLLFLVMPYAFGHEGRPQISTTSDVSGNQNVGIATNGDKSFVATFSDKSVWITGWSRVKHYCWIDEQEEPHCKEVKTEKPPKRKK